MLPLFDSLHRCAGGRSIAAHDDDATGDVRQPIVMGTGERPYSIAAGLAPVLRRTVAGRCTANPNCVVADRCPATPSMQRACTAAFQTWVRRTMAAAEAPAVSVEKWR
ncbi:hypothetical protein PQJ75_15415 [Rhodoplanes sp. TEM]|uniref:Uncharacterized protein n=1 Tax=Rhodoplanes tepidamans TaxID=200616 RepID=A0ABT5JGP5_RHOTP|nr:MULTISPECIES: hypothetical protein [Rhodoplanes]MDC7788526.1 hypothetical protein [Rhodoplanes tepidamans]MDC7985125.1 hypothetical protein [Rhodoplanes sp. TEM]MDQ0353415.1 hypothetical protein [Rhodoplanes tepidamans]